MGLVEGVGLVVGLDHTDDYHVVVVEAKAYGFKREILLGNAHLALVQHLDGPGLVASLQEQFRSIEEQLTLRHHAEESVEVLVVDEPAGAAQGIPGVDLVDLAAIFVHVHLAKVAVLDTVLDGNQVGGETVRHQVLLLADVDFAALAEHMDGPGPVVGRKQVEEEQLGLRQVVLVLGYREDYLVRNLVGEFGA